MLLSKMKLSLVLSASKEGVPYMATTAAQQVLCPVCHQSDQVMKASKAYESGVTRLAPPVMPVARVGMIRYVIVGFALVTVGVFFILIWSGTNGYGSWPVAVQVIQVVLTILAIVVALVLSLIALLRVVAGDTKTQKYLPAYDEALAKWNSLYYCKRDDVVFDPQTNKTISNAALRDMLTIDTTKEPQTAAVSH
jgi:amino acid transporter